LEKVRKVGKVSCFLRSIWNISREGRTNRLSKFIVLGVIVKIKLI